MNFMIIDDFIHISTLTGVVSTITEKNSKNQARELC